MRCMILRRLALVMILAVPLAATWGQTSPDAQDDDKTREIKMGREAVHDVEAEHKLVTDPEIVGRVQRIGEAIAKIANSEEVKAGYGNQKVYQFDYQFKVLEDEDVNAFSLPGGIIYINKGLLDYAQSDDELAGVLAHEVAHSAHHHMIQLLREQSKMDSQIALLLLAGMLSRVDSADLGNLMLGAQLVRVARASGYGQKAEADADVTAVTYVMKTGYNPVGNLTFLERLAHDYARKPNENMGILQTHPAPRERCTAVLSQLKFLKLPINRRAVTDALRAKAEPANVKGQQIIQVKLADKVLFRPAPIDGVLSSEQRAQAIVTKVNQMLDAEPPLREVTVSADGLSVLSRGKPVIIVTPQDSALNEKPAKEIARQSADVLKRAIWGEMVEKMY